MSKPLTHQDRARRVVKKLLPRSCVLSPQGIRASEIVARETYPRELLVVLRRYVTFHQGHVLPPGLAQTQDDARVVLALYGENEL